MPLSHYPQLLSNGTNIQKLNRSNSSVPN